MNQKQVTIKLFFNEAERKHYVQLGDYLYGIKERTALAMSDKEDLTVRRGADLKTIQTMSLNDEKTINKD